MKTSDFDYHLPQERIAQCPIEPRDHSKLMVLDRTKKTIEHTQFFYIVDFFKKGDVLVWNNSKVFKARLFGRLLSPEGEVLRDHDKKIELFLVRPKENPGVWQVLAKPGKHVQHGMRIEFAEDFYCDVMVKDKNGTILVQFPEPEFIVREKANQYGSIPIPPYVKDEPESLDVYQTAYAKEEGSVAAPTAGFHFTDDIIQKLKDKGVEFAEVTLHVGLGTFLPVKTDDVSDHTMHAEWVEISKETADTIVQAKRDGRRVIAVGTTSVRTLEGVAALGVNTDVHTAPLHAYTGDIDIFIRPGFEFRIVDAMITNFHLPKSTLLMLVSAFAQDREFILEAYKTAVEQEYRFYSFGDGMLIK